MKNDDRLFAVLLAVAVGVAGFAGVTGVAVAAETETDPIKARHLAMEEIGGSMQGLAAIAKGEQPFDAAVVAEKAGTIADRLEKAAKLFPEGSDKGDFPSRAKPEVWTMREGFDKGMKEAHAAALALSKVSDKQAFMPALGALGGSCRGCHETYRLPED